MVIIGTSYLIFLDSGWIPLVSTLFSFIGGGLLLLLFNAYQAKQEQLIIKKQVEEQEKAIAMLRLLLSETQQELEMGQTLSKIGHEKGSVLVERYQITQGLGKGSFGRTYLARDLQRPGKPCCVIKLLTPASKNPHFLQVARRLFKTEAKILERVGKHPQIPLLLAYIEQDNQFYLIQEYIKGQTLTTEFKEHQKYSEKEALGIIEEILLILSFIQKYKLIHRDIKPDNIIRRASDHRLVLIDFGAVKQIQPPHLNPHKDKTIIIGTEGYAPPEQLAGQPIMASDIYATGIMAIYALTGIKPNELAKNSLTGEVIWEPYARVSRPTAAIINKMVCYHFGDRYQTATEVLNDLRKLKYASSMKTQIFGLKTTE
jgi:serine/threonine protein kinase